MRWLRCQNQIMYLLMSNEINGDGLQHGPNHDEDQKMGRAQRAYHSCFDLSEDYMNFMFTEQLLLMIVYMILHCKLVRKYGKSLDNNSRRKLNINLGLQIVNLFVNAVCISVEFLNDVDEESPMHAVIDFVIIRIQYVVTLTINTFLLFIFLYFVFLIRFIKLAMEK